MTKLKVLKLNFLTRFHDRTVIKDPIRDSSLKIRFSFYYSRFLSRVVANGFRLTGICTVSSYRIKGTEHMADILNMLATAGEANLFHELYL